jgi:hypothetical protein
MTISVRTGPTLVPVIAAAMAVALQSQAPDDKTASMVERAGAYVAAYEKTFSGLVCEERQVQKLLRGDGRVRKVRELKSDLLLVNLGDDKIPAFRDVIEVDGKEVRNREDRLRKLFLGPSKPALEQAQSIAQESARYNIGVARFGISPLVPIRILLPRFASGFRFIWSGNTLAFEEFRSPSYLRQKTGEREFDLMAKGSLEIEAATGRVLSAELTSMGPPSSLSMTITVDYRDNPQLQLLLPTTMRERYWRPDRPREDRTEATSYYSNFRRFQVNTDEVIALPK